MTIKEQGSLIGILGGRSVVELQAKDGNFLKTIEEYIRNSRLQTSSVPQRSLTDTLSGKSVVELQEEEGDIRKIIEDFIKNRGFI